MEHFPTNKQTTRQNHNIGMGQLHLGLEFKKSKYLEEINKSEDNNKKEEKILNLTKQKQKKCHKF